MLVKLYAYNLSALFLIFLLSACGKSGSDSTQTDRDDGNVGKVASADVMLSTKSLSVVYTKTLEDLVVHRFFYSKDKSIVTVFSKKTNDKKPVWPIAYARFMGDQLQGEYLATKDNYPTLEGMFDNGKPTGTWHKWQGTKAPEPVPTPNVDLAHVPYYELLSLPLSEYDYSSPTLVRKNPHIPPYHTYEIEIEPGKDKSWQRRVMFKKSRSGSLEVNFAVIAGPVSWDIVQFDWRLSEAKEIYLKQFRNGIYMTSNAHEKELNWEHVKRHGIRVTVPGGSSPFLIARYYDMGDIKWQKDYYPDDGSLCVVEFFKRAYSIDAQKFDKGQYPQDSVLDPLPVSPNRK